MKSNKALGEGVKNKNSLKYNAGQALSSDSSLREFRSNIKGLVKKNKMVNFSSNDIKFYEKDVASLDRDLGAVCEKMPNMKKPETKPVASKKQVKKSTGL